MLKRKKVAEKPGLEKGVDFTGLPLEEIVLILRRLGLRLLGELLAPPCYPGKALPVKPQPGLNTMLTAQDIKILSRANIWKLRRTGSRKTGRIPKNLREQLSRALKKIITKSINGKITAPQWEIALCNRIALAQGGTKGDVLPEDLWPAAAEAAWCNADFQLSVAIKINDWLRRIRLLVPYELPIAILSPTTFWVLIALAKIKPLKFPDWFTKKRAGIRVSRRFQQEAQWQMIRNEWAGFWDQWIIQLCSQRWPTAFTQLENRLCKALMGLPLLRTNSASTLCKKKGVLKFSLWPLVEKWFDLMDGIKRFPRPGKDYRRIILLNFTVPNWENQMPDFFKAINEATVSGNED